MKSFPRSAGISVPPCVVQVSDFEIFDFKCV